MATSKVAGIEKLKKKKEEEERLLYQ